MGPEGVILSTRVERARVVRLDRHAHRPPLGVPSLRWTHAAGPVRRRGVQGESGPRPPAPPPPSARQSKIERGESRRRFWASHLIRGTSTASRADSLTCALLVVCDVQEDGSPSAKKRESQKVFLNGFRPRSATADGVCALLRVHRVDGRALSF